MPEPRDAKAIIEHAEQAAATGDYSSAETLLREAAALQEQTLGPLHPDLANTLNNLGIVCEMTDNPIDAEHYFRRACTIATATLPADHPFVLTSRKNLHDFCAARGRPTELRPSPPGVAAWLEAPVQRPAAPHESSTAANENGTPIPRKRSLRPLALGAVAAVALLIAIFMMRSRDRGAEVAQPPPSVAIAPAAETPAPTPTLPPAHPTAAPEPSVQQPPTLSAADAITARPHTITRSDAPPTVVTAQLCTALRAWRCEPAEGQAPPGPMFFYTQVKSATATTIEHRWYQGDRLRKTVRLRVDANPGAGYRTYSRTTISSQPADGWRVELRSSDGAVLQEVRFTVR